MNMTEEKKALRWEIRAREKTLSETDIAASDRALTAQLLSLPFYREAETVFCFVSIQREVDTHPLLADALAKGKRLCVPRCVAEGEMELVLLTDLADLRPGAFGILEPREGLPLLTADDIDFALVPCLSCTRDGQRLGKGGGYYDRFLSRYRGSMAVVCREALLLSHIPMDVFDVHIPWVITEKGVFPGKTAVKTNGECLP